jgi:hypothetical protein
MLKYGGTFYTGMLHVLMCKTETLVAGGRCETVHNAAVTAGVDPTAGQLLAHC